MTGGGNYTTSHSSWDLRSLLQFGDLAGDGADGGEAAEANTGS